VRYYHHDGVGKSITPAILLFTIAGIFGRIINRLSKPYGIVARGTDCACVCIRESAARQSGFFFIRVQSFIIP
jgi:hypothetical protein